MLGAERIGAPVGKVKVFKSFVAALGILNEIDKSEYSFVDLFMSGSALSLCPVWKICNFQFSKKFEPSAPELVELHQISNSATNGRIMHRRESLPIPGPLSQNLLLNHCTGFWWKKHHESPWIIPNLSEDPVVAPFFSPQLAESQSRSTRTN